ncbi:hypothetical protein [Pelagibacterium lentulum]|uniref:DUF2946 domain-containing protein n=1 Tax=Pelagibacterium lentulum TaxID=2029865 RepID=A0A916R7K4_9HYPH|nr:hypothetical protein [Pelagibacterium lentulum]GGA43382.1 hypothetical protein GCM10011499_11210 [Pelagibacterium lentulum]
MKLAGRTTQLMIGALLALAVSLAWLPVGVGTLEHHPQMHGSGIEEAHGAAPRDSDLGEMPGAQYPCQPCGADCCMMTHCHPGLAIEPSGILFRAQGDKTTDAIGADAFGGPPDVAVPPPRILLV